MRQARRLRFKPPAPGPWGPGGFAAWLDQQDDELKHVARRMLAAGGEPDRATAKAINSCNRSLGRLEARISAAPTRTDLYLVGAIVLAAVAGLVLVVS